MPERPKGRQLARMAILLFCFQRLSWGYEDCGGAVWGDQVLVVWSQLVGQYDRPQARLKRSSAKRRDKIV